MEEPVAVYTILRDFNSLEVCNYYICAHICALNQPQNLFQYARFPTLPILPKCGEAGKFRISVRITCIY